jgi:hypothetical protein
LEDSDMSDRSSARRPRPKPTSRLWLLEPGPPPPLADADDWEEPTKPDNVIALPALDFVFRRAVREEMRPYCMRLVWLCVAMGLVAIAVCVVLLAGGR